MKKNRLPKIVIVVGPTASGKSDLAIMVAKKFGGEIVSADSRQLYKGMEIGAAIEPGTWRKKRGQPPSYVVRGVPHHLMAVLPPNAAITVAEWKQLAEAAIEGILERGKVPVVVGGTGLYVKALAENFFLPAVPPNEKLRAALEKKSSAQLYAMLRRKDPAYAARIPPQNRRYIVRALEVMAGTGKKFSEAQQRGAAKYAMVKIGLKIPREELYARINARVDAMLKRGLLREARRLAKKFGWDAAPMTAIGYRQFRDFLETREGLEQAVEALKRDTRRYAKRQLTWLRREGGVRWVKDGREVAAVVGKFLN